MTVYKERVPKEEGGSYEICLWSLFMFSLYCKNRHIRVYLVVFQDIIILCILVFPDDDLYSSQGLSFSFFHVLGLEFSDSRKLEWYASFHINAQLTMIIEYIYVSVPVAV